MVEYLHLLRCDRTLCLPSMNFHDQYLSMFCRGHIAVSCVEYPLSICVVNLSLSGRVRNRVVTEHEHQQWAATTLAETREVCCHRVVATPLVLQAHLLGLGRVAL